MTMADPAENAPGFVQFIHIGIENRQYFVKKSIWHSGTKYDIIRTDWSLLSGNSLKKVHRE